MAEANPYLERALSLLPPGQMDRSLDSNWAKVLMPLANEFLRLEQRALAVLREADPRTTMELFEEWEQFAGLPDSCTIDDGTMSERREALIAKLLSQGNFGFGANEVRDDYGYYAIGPQAPDNDHEYHWIVHVYGDKHVPFAFGHSGFGDPMLYIRAAAELECTLNQLKPAHTHLSFIYHEREELENG